MINLPRVVCMTVCVPSPYSSIPWEKTSELCNFMEFVWNGLKVSKVDNLKNRTFLEACHLKCEIKKARLFSFQNHQGIKTIPFTHHGSLRGGWQLCWLSPPPPRWHVVEWQQTVTSVVIVTRWLTNAVITLTSACQRRQRHANAGSALLALDRHWHWGSHTVKALRCFCHSRMLPTLLVLRQCRPNAVDARPALTQL